MQYMPLNWLPFRWTMRTALHLCKLSFSILCMDDELTLTGRRIIQPSMLLVAQVWGSIFAVLLHSKMWHVVCVLPKPQIMRQYHYYNSSPIVYTCFRPPTCLDSSSSSSSIYTNQWNCLHNWGIQEGQLVLETEQCDALIAQGFERLYHAWH